MGGFEWRRLWSWRRLASVGALRRPEFRQLRGGHFSFPSLILMNLLKIEIGDYLNLNQKQKNKMKLKN